MSISPDSHWTLPEAEPTGIKGHGDVGITKSPLISLNPSRSAFTVYHGAIKTPSEFYVIIVQARRIAL